MRFAFYGRVSTEDHQDPEASRNWQLVRARGLITPAGHEIVTEYFDVGTSRSLPWKRRPRAARLLTALRNAQRGRPPYGYRLADAGPHANPGKAADGKRLHRLEPEPSTAPVVQRIYREYLAGTGIYAIAEGLTRDGILSPSAADPRRNAHRSVQACGLMSKTWRLDTRRRCAGIPNATGSTLKPRSTTV